VGVRPPNVRNALQPRTAGTFVVLTFAISWAIWLAMIAGGVSIATTPGLVLNVVATAGPSIAAVLLAIRLGGGELARLAAGFSPSLLSVRWVVVALVLPLLMVAAAIVISVGAIGAALPVVTGVVVGRIVVEFVRVLFFGGPLEEELGWRGFLLPRLQARRSAFSASILLGLIWGLWHIPLYFVLGTGQYETAASAGVTFAIAAFVVWTMGLSVLFTWLFNETGGSLVIAILFHTAVNLAAFVPAAVGSTGAASFLYPLITWIVALIVAARYGRQNLSSRPRVVVEAS
jgi:membrane protease YdiL (CAAX protease family)